MFLIAGAVPPGPEEQAARRQDNPVDPSDIVLLALTRPGALRILLAVAWEAPEDWVDDLLRACAGKGMLAGTARLEDVCLRGSSAQRTQLVSLLGAMVAGGYLPSRRSGLGSAESIWLYGLHALSRGGVTLPWETVKPMLLPSAKETAPERPRPQYLYDLKAGNLHLHQESAGGTYPFRAPFSVSMPGGEHQLYVRNDPWLAWQDASADLRREG